MNKNLQQFLSTLVQAALRNAMLKRNKDEGKRKKGKLGEGDRENEMSKNKEQRTNVVKSSGD